MAYTATGTYNDAALTADDQAKINALKQQYTTAQAAGNTSGMEAAHAAAEAIRSNYGYSGGGDGSEYNPIGASITKQAGYTAPTLQSASSQEEYINSLYKAQQEANLQALKTAYDSNVNTLDAQAAKIPEIYQTQRNATAVESEKQKQAYNEYAASSGINTGAGSQVELSRSNQLQGNLSSLNKAEAQALNDIETQRTQLSTEYQNAVAQAIKDGNLEKAQALYNEAVRVDESLISTALNQAQLEYNAWLANNSVESAYQDALNSANEKNQANAQAQVDTILQTGGVPSSQLVSASGYSQEYIDALRGYYTAQLSKGVSVGSGGGTAYSDSTATDTQNTQRSSFLAYLNNAAANYPDATVRANKMISAIEGAQKSGLITEAEARSLLTQYGLMG